MKSEKVAEQSTVTQNLIVVVTYILNVNVTLTVGLSSVRVNSIVIGSYLLTSRRIVRCVFLGMFTSYRLYKYKCWEIVVET